MRLFAVQVVVDMVVWASDEDHAKQLAAELAPQEARNEVPSLRVDAVKPVLELKDLPSTWEAGNLPWGRSDDVTVGEILGVKP